VWGLTYPKSYDCSIQSPEKDPTPEKNSPPDPGKEAPARHKSFRAIKSYDKTLPDEKTRIFRDPIGQILAIK